MELSLVEKNSVIVNARTGTTVFTVLIDTGASFSVYTGNEDELLLFEPNAIDTKSKVYISGFGGGKICKVFILPEVLIGEFKILNLPIALFPNKGMKQDIILSTIVFNKTPFTIDYPNYKLYLNSSIDEVRCCLKRSNIIGVVDSFICFTNE